MNVRTYREQNPPTPVNRPAIPKIGKLIPGPVLCWRIEGKKGSGWTA